MTGKKFLNPTSKIILCALGMLIMAYFLYADLSAGAFNDRVTILRMLVFLGFAYLLVQSVREFVRPPGQ